MIKKVIIPLLFLCIQANLFSQNGIKKTEILILGTPHLFQIDQFENSMLDKVKEKLNTHDFEVICIEKMPGQLLYDIASRKDSAFNDMKRMQRHLKLADSVQAHLGKNFLESKQNITHLLSKNHLTNKDRKNLFYNFIATTNIASAALQYLYLKDETALFVSSFDKEIVQYIEKELASSNEYYSLAVPLAFHKQLNKIEPIDNLQDMALLAKYYPTFEDEMKNNPDFIANVLKAPVFIKSDSLKTQAVKNKDLSELYSYVNSDEFMKEDYNAQWKIWFETNFSSNSDRARYSLWEMRNLQISANILDVVARNPTKNILVIIGASHKYFLEKYLRQIPDIEIINY